MESKSDNSCWSLPLGLLSAAHQESMQKQKKSYCSVLNCYNNSTPNPHLSYFKLPSDPQRATQWLEKIHRARNRTKKMLVCETHFESRYINCNNESRKRLVAQAVPTLHLPVAVDLECTPDVDDDLTATGTNQINTKKEVANKKKLLISKRIPIKRAKQIIKTFIDRNELNTQYSQKNIAQIIKLNNKFRQPSEGEKFTDEFKFFALKLYLSSPKTYKVLQSVLNLPSISTLYGLYIPTSTEVCENLIIALKIKVDTMTDVQKQCAVCIGTIAVKANLHYDVKKDQIVGFHDVDGTQRLEAAETALIVMVRGIFDKWKQAVGFSLLAQHQDYKDLRTYIYDIIHKMTDIGLNVRVFISDIESDFVGILKEKKINFSNPFFVVNGQKVYYMYDPHHLMKVVCENLMIYDFHFNGMKAKWEHITACYDHDVKKELRLAPKLTCYHIIHTHLQSEKDKIKLVAEVFSKTTAVAIATYADLKVLDESAKETVEWIITMNKLFAMLNFTLFNFDSETATAFSGEEEQVYFLNEMLSRLKTLRVVDADKGTDVTNNAKFIYKLKLTIKVILSLHKELKDEYSKLAIIGLNRDCLDIYFDKVGHLYGRLPTSRQIQLSLRTMRIFNVFQCNGNSKKKSTDNLDFFLMEAKKFHFVMFEQIDSKVHSINACYNFTANVDLNAVELSKENALQYMAAYLLYEGYQQHNDCEAMKCYAFEKSNSVTVILTIRSKNQTDNTIVVVMVPTAFVEFIESMEITLKLYFETEYQPNPLMGLREHLFSENVTFSMPCECFPLDYIKLLYMRFRFNILLKYNNKQFQNNECHRKYFKVNEL